jgi:hypothetical protein
MVFDSTMNEMCMLKTSRQSDFARNEDPKTRAPKPKADHEGIFINAR